MPQLPSGKHVALDPSPLQEVITEAFEGIKVQELMSIESTAQLFSHINILYFRPTAQNSSLPLAKYSIVPPEGFETYFSGFNLISIKNEVDSWPPGDQQALIQFLNEERTNGFLEGLLSTVKEYQTKLSDHPTTLQGLMALWWKLGVHPLQNEDENG